MELTLVSGPEILPVEVDYAPEIAASDGAISGRIHTPKPQKFMDHTFELDLAFNAPLTATNSPPVTATAGRALPAGGGAIGAAYIAHHEAVRAAKTYEELYLVKRRVGAAGGPLLKSSAEIEEELRAIPEYADLAKRETYKRTLFQLERSYFEEGARVTGGFATADAATLSYEAVDGVYAVEGRINMHLEGGQWKLGDRLTRVVQKK
jgi:hypothetical protein